MNAEIAFHAYANLFPLLDEESLQRLADDIKTNGLQDPVALYEGQVLDGRNRYRACLLAEIEPQFTEYAGTDPLSFVISRNAQRRDLTQSQRAAVAVNCDEVVNRLKEEAKQRQLRKPDFVVAKLPPQNGEKSRDKLAKTIGVSARYVQDALAIKNLPAEVERLGASEHVEVREVAAQFQDAAGLFNQVLNGEKTLADAVRRKQDLEYQLRVAQVTVEKRQTAQVVVADPPWQYDVQISHAREIENHYATLPFEDIAKHAPVTSEDCVLFLWTTAPKLMEAIEVFRAWGFEYVTHAVWDKKKIGTGYWFRGRHELILVARKGNPPLPIPSVRVDSVFEGGRREHSEKPEEFYQWVDRAFGDKVRLEMYARKKREGWQVWGNEV